MKIIKWIFACLACLPLASHAQVNDAARALKILPAPKDVRMAEGRIVIKPSTTILISNSEDRTAAETLQKEIHDRTGMKLSIELATAAPKTTGHISLGRLTDPGLRSYLEAQGVKTGDELGDSDLDKQGYVIRVTDSGALVAGRTAQGLFYGVQTLRQLLRPEGPAGKTLAIPGPRHSRLAQHGMAGRARRHQPRPDPYARLLEDADPHLGRVQDQLGRVQYGARIRPSRPSRSFRRETLRKTRPRKRR